MQTHTQMTGQRAHWIYQILYILLFLSMPAMIYTLWLNYFVYHMSFLRPLWFVNLKPQLLFTYGYTGIPALIAGLIFAQYITSKKYISCVVLTALGYFAISFASYAFILLTSSKQDTYLLNLGKAPAHHLYNELVQTFYISPFVLFNLLGLILTIVLATLLALRLRQRDH